MKHPLRGEIWSIAGSGDYAGKPRPAVIVQDDSFDNTQSIVVCAFTTTERDASLLRLRVEPDTANGLQLTSFLMADKIASLSRDKLGKRIGKLDATTMRSLNRSLIVFLGLYDSSSDA